MQGGWIKLHRQFLSSSVWKNANLTRFWIWCLLKASHSSVKTRRGYTEVELSPGQLIFGRLKAADETGLTPDEVRTCVKVLKADKSIDITRHFTKQFSILTIIKWDRYQIVEIENPQPFAREAPTCPQRVPTYKNDQELIPPPPAHARVGEEGEGGKSEPPPYEPPDIPAPLLTLAREVISLTPEGALTGWMTVQKWPTDWISKAIMRSAEKGKRGNEAIAYSRGILESYQRNGGPPNDDDHKDIGTIAKGRSGDRRATAKGKYAHIDAVNFGH